MQTTVSFPGLGIGEFTISRTAFSLFGREVYWYGVIIMLGIVAAFLHTLWRAKHEGVKSDHLYDMALFVVPAGIIGARLYYVLTTLDSGNYKNFLDVIAIWDGGLAIYGGIIAGAAAVIGVCLFKKLNVLKLMDMIAPGVMIAQAIGRWGNFCNGEAFGVVVPEGHPLYFMRMGLISDFTPPYMKYYHPTFLYESLWNVVGFILITVLYRKKKLNGQNVLMYLTWYGFGRMFIEGLRTDSLYVGSFRISQVVGGACFVLGAAALVTLFVLSKKGKLPGICEVSLVPVVRKAKATQNNASAQTTAQTTAHAEVDTSNGAEDGEVASDEGADPVNESNPSSQTEE